MNDDELTTGLAHAMRVATAADEPSAGLVQTLVRTRVGGSRRPYLVPLGATAVVTALTAGGFVVADLPASPSTTAGVGDSASPTAPAPTTAPVPSSRPSAVATSAVTTPPTSAAPATAAAATTSAPTRTTPPPTVPAPRADDSALFAQAASYSVTEKTITDPTLADTKTTTKTVTLVHDSQKLYYVNRQEVTWDELAKLPADAEAFGAAVKEPGHPSNAVEKGLQGLLQTDSPLPMPQRKAAMELAMGMPGATVNKEAKDADGRPAVQVSIESDWMQDSYYFDPITFHLLEASSYVTPDWVAHWTPIDKTAGRVTPPLGTGYQVIYSNWTITATSAGTSPTASDAVVPPPPASRTTD